MIDAVTRKTLHAILIRESHSLYQYLREVPPWVGLHSANVAARMNELASAEIEVVESISRWLQKQRAGLSHLGAFPDYTPYNDAALHFLLPTIVREQKQLLAELERDHDAIGDSEAAVLVHRLLELKRRHVPQLEELHAPPHTFTTALA